jgi:uncharacterized protein (DUF433 family)
LEGTRIRVSLIVACHRQGLTVVDLISQYPHLRRADIYDALAYAEDHPDEVAADLAVDDASAAQLQ